MFDLTGKVAIITGASQGIGRTIASLIARSGANVICVARSKSKIKELSNEINDQGHMATYLPCDVGDGDAFSNIIKTVVEQFGKLDILINNAAKDPKVKKGGGLTPDSRFETMTEDYWQEGIDAALNGTFLCSQVVSNKMLENIKKFLK